MRHNPPLTPSQGKPYRRQRIGVACRKPADIRGACCADRVVKLLGRADDSRIASELPSRLLINP